MEKMSTSAGLLWFFGGVGWFLLWLALAIWGWGSKVTIPETPKQFFTPAQYSILYATRGPKFDPQHPNPSVVLNKDEINKLKSWGLNDCVQTDGLIKQDTGILSGGGCYCENAPAVKAVFEKGFAVQLSNTLSTFPLSLMGLWILGWLVFNDSPDRTNFMTVTPVFALCYAAMTIILGPLSMMLHLGLRNVGGWFDSLSLYIWFSFVACYGLFRFIVACTQTTPDACPRWTYWLFGAAWAALTAVPAATTYPGMNGLSADTWYPILGGLALVGELLLWIGDGHPTFFGRIPDGVFGKFASSPATSWTWYGSPPDLGGSWWFVTGGITFGVALTIWTLSFTQKPLCSPTAAIQGHAVFHTLSAFALGFLYKYYRHEGEA